MNTRGFTLIETLVAVTLLTVAIVAPMTLASQSLSAAQYSRDQITASYLAQEGIEAVRSVRDDNILTNAEGVGSINILSGIPDTNNNPFIVDAHVIPAIMTVCTNGICPPLQTDGELYGYDSSWTSTNFTRTLTACYVQADGTCKNTPSDIMRIAVSVSWQTGTYQARTFTVTEDLYRWVNDGTAIN